MTDKGTHTSDCDWHVDQYPWECTCGFIPRKKAMDNLIAQDADLIDNPLQAAVRELLTDDSMEHLDFFTHNLVQAFDKHGLKAVRAEQAAELAKFKALAEALAGAVREIKDSWDWWQVDTYDRCSSVVEDAINEALREYKEATNV